MMTLDNDAIEVEELAEQFLRRIDFVTSRSNELERVQRSLMYNKTVSKNDFNDLVERIDNLTALLVEQAKIFNKVVQNTADLSLLVNDLYVIAGGK
jgi:CRISPR/Cas system-associated endoribonuclease Cas2